MDSSEDLETYRHDRRATGVPIGATTYVSTCAGSWSAAEESSIQERATPSILSSGGILIDAGRHLPAGSEHRIVGRVARPAPQRGGDATGRLRTRSSEPRHTRIAMRMVQHEFRTAAGSAEHRGLPPADPRAPFLISNAALNSAASGNPSAAPRTAATSMTRRWRREEAPSFFGRRSRRSLMNSSRALAYFGVPGLPSTVAHSSGVIS